jgi:hypothetical protein
MASALDLLLSRQAAAAGVGIGTRRNRVLPAPTPTTDIPGRTGTADYALRKSVPVCVPEDLMSPLTETSYAARTYHATRRQYSTNGVYSFPLKPINRITVSTGDGLPKTRALCMAADDGSTGLRVLEHDIIETGRTYTAAAKVQRVYINGTYIPVAFDARLSAISFGGKCGRPFSLQIYPTGGVAAEHGSIFGAHVLGTATITSARVMGLNAKTTGTLKKFEIVLASPGKLVERIEDAAWTVLNSLVTPFPNEEFPWNRRVHRFAGLKCFQRVNGNIYTDQTLSTLIDATARPASFGADTEFPPRYFKLTANADYTSPSTNYVFPGDAIFPRRMFCFPEAVYTSRMNPFRLLPADHIFKCAAGQVWKIGVTITAGTGATDNYKIYLRNRFDTFLESAPTVNLLLAEVNAKNWSAYPGTGYSSAPDTAVVVPSTPTLRPVSTAFVSKPDGREAYLIGYWEDTGLSPSSARARTITTVLHILFSEAGSSDPTSGSGISADVAEYDVFENFVNTKTNSSVITGVDSGGWTGESLTYIGNCGAANLSIHQNKYVFSHETIEHNDQSQLSYKRLLWIYVGNDGVFDFVKQDFYFQSTTAVNSTGNSGEINQVRTDFCIDSSSNTTGYNGVISGPVISYHSASHSVTDVWAAIVSSVRGALIHKTGLLVIADASVDTSDDLNASWTWPPSPPPDAVHTDERTDVVTSSFYGVPIGAGMQTRNFSDGTYSGTLYTPAHIVPLPSAPGFVTLPVISGASWHTMDFRFMVTIDGVAQDFSDVPGQPFLRQIRADNKIYHGHVVPLDTPIQRVCVNARAGTIYIAPSDADAGHFY